MLNSGYFKIIDCLQGMKELPDNSVDLILTDPPFNVGINYGDTTNDDMTDEQYRDWFFARVAEMSRVLKEGRPLIIFSGDKKMHPILDAVGQVPGIIFHHFLKWHKPTCQRALSGFVLFYRTELACLYTKGKSDLSILNRKRLYSDTLTFENVSEGEEDEGELVDHPCRRPVMLYKQIIDGFTQEGDIVLDPFVGSGTTMFACGMSNRKGIGFEINPAYRETIEKRMTMGTWF